MEKRTIAQAAIEVLKGAKQPLTAAEITQAILDKELYTFRFASLDGSGLICLSQLWTLADSDFLTVAEFQVCPGRRWSIS
jgi:hypothetical protein